MQYALKYTEYMQDICKFNIEVFLSFSKRTLKEEENFIEQKKKH